MGSTLEVSLIEWPETPDLGGPRLLGRCSDPRLVAAVQDSILAARRRELARIRGADPAPRQDD